MRRAVLTVVALLSAAPAIPAMAAEAAALNNCAPSRPVDVKIAACTAVIAAQPPNRRSLERAFNTRGLAYLQSNNAAAAISDFSHVILLNPTIAGYFDNRQNAYRQAGNFPAAFADSEQAIRLASGYSFVWTAQGSLLGLMDNLPAAIADYDKALDLQPKDAGALFERGRLWQRSGNAEKAIADFTSALLIDARFRGAYRERGLALASLGRVDSAADDFEAALRLQPDDQGAVDGIRALAATAAASGREVPGPQATRPVAGGRRIALVIGNSAYQNVPVLPNPRTDAQQVATALRHVGFETMVENDLTREQFASALAAFATRSAEADWALIYFAGHGIEIGGVNYLIPVDAQLTTDRSAEFEAVPLTQAMDAVEGAHKMRLVLLDACRANPFANRMRRSEATRAVSRGLARPPETDPGLLVVYAARDGEVASDGEGSAGSPFASAFVSEMQKPGTEVRRLFDLVSDDVIEKTGDRQHPLTYGRVPGREDFYFEAAPH